MEDLDITNPDGLIPGFYYRVSEKKRYAYQQRDDYESDTFIGAFIRYYVDNNYTFTKTFEFKDTDGQVRTISSISRRDYNFHFLPEMSGLKKIKMSELVPSQMYYVISRYDRNDFQLDKPIAFTGFFIRHYPPVNRNDPLRRIGRLRGDNVEFSTENGIMNVFGNDDFYLFSARLPSALLNHIKSVEQSKIQSLESLAREQLSTNDIEYAKKIGIFNQPKLKTGGRRITKKKKKDRNKNRKTRTKKHRNHK
jgi:hypothetical protein